MPLAGRGQLNNGRAAENLAALRTERYFLGRAARADIPRALDILKWAGVGNAPTEADELDNGQTEIWKALGLSPSASTRALL